MTTPHPEQPVPNSAGQPDAARAYADLERPTVANAPARPFGATGVTETTGTTHAATEPKKANIFLRILQLRAMNFRGLEDFGLFLLRVMSLPLILHGWHKLMHFDGFVNGALAHNSVGSLAPTLIGVLVVAGQILLPIALTLGLFTRISGLLLAAMFTGIIILFNIPGGVISPETGGLTFDASLLYLTIGVVLFFTGAGRMSVDGATGDRVRVRA